MVMVVKVVMALATLAESQGSALSSNDGWQAVYGDGDKYEQALVTGGRGRCLHH